MIDLKWKSIAPIAIQFDVCITNNNSVTLLNFMVSGEVKTGINFKLIIIRTELYKHWWYKLNSQCRGHMWWVNFKQKLQ